LKTHTQSVKEKLQNRFKDSNVDVYYAMRYQNPSMYDVMEIMRKEHYDHIVVLPLFPQYASASNGSAIALAMKIMSKWWSTPQVSIINQFWDNEGYIDSIIERSKQFDLKEYDHIMFSYHGLPIRHVDKVYEGNDLCEDQTCESEINDNNRMCYKATCYAATRLIAEKLGITEDDYTVCFQSRLNKKWLTPFSDVVVEEQAKKGAKKILAFSPAFVADCLETVIEIGDEYQEIFEANGGEKIQLVPSSNDHDRFIDGLEDLIRGEL
jgi:ferrochelatase